MNGSVSITVAAARDACIEGVDLLLTVYRGAGSSFDRAIATDPGFVLGHIGKARAFQLAGNLAAMRESLATALSLGDGGSARDLSHIDIFCYPLPAKLSRRWSPSCANGCRFTIAVAGCPAT